MSLETPEKIRILQRKLYRKAKEEPNYRFYQLYDKIYREDILIYAYAQVKVNDGAPGADGEDFETIEAQGLAEWLRGIIQELRTKTYKPKPVNRVWIDKPGGGQRPLGIPCIKDRVVQTAAKVVLEPIFEADLEPNTYGYRPKRSAKDAIQEVHKLLKTSYSDVVDADLSKYFDTIPHCELLKSVARRIVDRNMLHLIKMWLKAPAVERDENGKQRITGGRNSQSGTPQGGVVSPLLANLYMNRFLKHWRKTGKGELWEARIISYADDFVILSRGHAQEAREWTRGVMQRLGLTLNEAKTSIKDARREKFDFLGYSFGPHCFRKRGKWYRGASPSKKSQQRVKKKVDELLRANLISPWEEIRTGLNQTLRGWAAYFSYGTRTMAYRAVDNHVYESVRHFLRRRHKVQTRGTRQFSGEKIFGKLGVVRLRDIQCGVRP